MEAKTVKRNYMENSTPQSGVRTQTEFDGISEFVSRRGRIKFLEMLVQKLGSRSEVSETLQISKSTLSGWLNERNRHPSNSSFERVLELGWKVNPKETIEILNEELDTFDKAIATFVRGGANCQANES
ncbi:hypothetical protein AKJ41_01515 [candidate division MSBL1 archaeon SCGC-AAA259O05]|uniref:Uncharacterized protein n=1 Tax=candidate division MSBL1 archaeon SCGC-AAA259O05 TaxID=1698271 RepID=A0A133V4S3_9EURY|nr:hypothetical protein AKJ41_01515 [candidate division MSBL1 archaeon SCGC-AAA259O05]